MYNNSIGFLFIACVINFKKNMGVVTTADERRDEAKDYIEKAYNCLIEATDDDTWGADEYEESYIETLEEIAIQLRKLKRKI